METTRYIIVPASIPALARQGVVDIKLCAKRQIRPLAKSFEGRMHFGTAARCLARSMAAGVTYINATDHPIPGTISAKAARAGGAALAAEHKREKAWRAYAAGCLDEELSAARQAFIAGWRAAGGRRE
jgi:hypothetical protein